MALCAGAGDRSLYQVLEQQQAQVGGNLMGSDHTYIIPGGKPAPSKKCALDPSLHLSHAAKPADPDVLVPKDRTAVLSRLLLPCDVI